MSEAILRRLGWIFVLATSFSLALIIVSSFVSSSQAETVPSGFEDATLITDAGLPTDIAFLPDGRMLVADKRGSLGLFGQDGSSMGTLLDLSETTCSNLERGLLGVEPDSEFESNGYIYVYYTHKRGASCPGTDPDNPDNPVNRVSRFTLQDGAVSPESGLVLIDDIPSPNGNHNGGDLSFGKDGYLYASVGDGGCDYTRPDRCGAYNGTAQRLNTLNGKIIRVTSDGGTPPSNPYAGSSSAASCADGPVAAGTRCLEIFASGLRNPFRMAFDPNASRTRLFTNDVGQAFWEEIDDGRRGADYGWNLCEGRHDNARRPGSVDCASAPYTGPVWEYNHETGCESITGGAFVPEGTWGESYSGAYLYGDFVCNKIFSLTPRKDGGFSRTILARLTGTPERPSGTVVTLAFGPYGSDQALYYTTLARGGEVHRIAQVGNQP